MNILGRNIAITIAAGGMSLAGVIQADACGLGVTDFSVTASVLNVRTAPNTSSMVTKKLSRGSIVTPTELSKDRSWGKIGDNQWVSMQYLKMIDKCTVPDNNGGNTSSNTETVTMRELEVTASSLNVRKSPSIDSPVVGSMKRGESDVTNTKSGDWYKVSKGWIHKDYVSVTILSLGSNSTEEGPIDAPAGEVSKDRVVANVPQGDVLNVRYSRVLSGSIKDTLNNGDEVTIINDINNVSYIKYVNKHGRLEFGYVASRYLK